MTYLTLMLTSIGVILDSFVSKLNLLFADVDEYLKGKSHGDSKCIHSKTPFQYKPYNRSRSTILNEQ